MGYMRYSLRFKREKNMFITILALSQPGFPIYIHPSFSIFHGFPLRLHQLYVVLGAAKEGKVPGIILT